MRKTKLVFVMAIAFALPLANIAAEYAAADTPSPSGSSSSNSPSSVRGEEGPATTVTFDEVDTNHDGYISAEEAKRSATALAEFKRLDTNHDGKISRDEWKAGGMP